MNQLSRNEDKQIEKHECKAVYIGNDEIFGTRTLFSDTLRPKEIIPITQTLIRFQKVDFTNFECYCNNLFVIFH